MKTQKILFIGIIFELCLVPLLDAKRSFGITRSRNKNKGPSVRRNQHGHEYDDPPVPAVHPKPSAPEMRKPVMNNHSPPVGPPPAYPGMGHHAAPAYGAPPAYHPSYANPPSYSSGGFHQNQYSHSGFNQFQPQGMGVMPMSASPYGGYRQNSGFGSGIMTNLFAGLAGYQLAKAFSGGHHRDREVIVIDNRQPINSDSAQPQAPPSNVDQRPTNQAYESYSTEIPQQTASQIGPAMNEYNYYGIPQYGIPLYGYSLPSQITDYYQTAIIPANREQTQQPMRKK